MWFDNISLRSGFKIIFYQLLLIVSKWSGQANPSADDNYSMCAGKKIFKHTGKCIKTNRSWRRVYFWKSETKRNKNFKFVGFLENQQTMQVLHRLVRCQTKEKQPLKKRKTAKSCKNWTEILASTHHRECLQF